MDTHASEPIPKKPEDEKKYVVAIGEENAASGFEFQLDWSSGKSAETDKLFEALATAQGEMSAVEKDAANPFFKSSYSSLGATQEACRGPLARQGLAVTQLPFISEDGHVLRTILGHKSGQWISCEMRVQTVKAGPQATGSGLTYARRYSYSAIVGICSEADDDGELANGRAPKPKATPPGGTHTPETSSTPDTTSYVATEVLEAFVVDFGVKNKGRTLGSFITKDLERFAIEMQEWVATQSKHPDWVGNATVMKFIATADELLKRRLAKQ
jgi:hypothetical protein